MPATWVPCSAELWSVESPASVGSASRPGCAVARVGVVADEVVAADDALGQLGMGDDAGVDDGDGDVGAAGGTAPRLRRAHHG